MNFMYQRFSTFIDHINSGSTRDKLVMLSILLFPTLSMSARHWLSGIFTLLAIVALFVTFRGHRKLYKEEKVFLVLLALYILCFFISATLNDWSVNSIRRVGNVMKYVFFFPLYLLIRQYTDLHRLLLVGIVIGGIVLGLQALYDVLVSGNTQAWGIYGPIVFGDLSVLFFAITLILVIFNNRLTLSTYILTFALLMAVLAGLLSGSRNAWVAAVFSVLIIPFLCFPYVKYKKTLLLLPVIIFIISATTFALNNSMQDRLALAYNEVKTYLTQGAPENIPIKSNSAGYRLEQWRVAMHIYKDAPFFGHGGGNAGKNVNRYAEKGLAHPDMINLDTETTIGGLHNTYFEALVNEGIIGLVIILMFLLYPLWIFIRTRKYNPLLSTIGIVFMANYLIFGITENPFVHDNFTSVYLLFLAVFFSEAVRSKYTAQAS